MRLANMISRCPSCGVPAPDEARQCPACDWDFITNKKGAKQASLDAHEAAPATKPAEPEAEEPPSPPDMPSPVLGMAQLPKVVPKFTPPDPDSNDNPFALPVARTLAPNPGESLFSPALPPAQKPPKAVPSEPVEPPAAPKSKKSARPEPAESAPAEPPQKGMSLPSFDAKPAASQAPAPEPSATLAALVAANAVSAETTPVAADPKAPESAPKDPGDKKPERKSPLYLAMLGGGALALLTAGALFVMLRSEPQGGARPKGSSPFGRRAADDETVKPNIAAPAPLAVSTAAPSLPPPPEPAVSTGVAAPARPTATFALPVRTAPAPTPAPTKAAPLAKAKPAPPAAAKKPAGPRWVFEGVVYDLLTTQGVFGARMVFLDAEENTVASVETGADGRYRATMPSGPPEGYVLRVAHDDYARKHIDELDSTSSLRKADLEQRKFLMEAGSRAGPWIGSASQTVRRDLALVPKAADQ